MSTVATAVTLGGCFTGLGGRIYTAIGVEGSKIRVRFEDGNESLLSRPEHMMAQRRVEAEQAQNRKFNRKEIRARSMEIDLFTIGFLANRGYLFANMPPHFEKDYVELYQKLTGEESKHYSITQPEVNKWAISTQVAFGATQEELDALDFGELEVHQSWVGDEKRWGIYSNDFYWALVSIGFRSGRGSHDVEKIHAQLDSSHEHIDEFIRGFVAS